MAADSTQYWLLDNNTQYFMAYEGKKIRCGIGAQVADSGETKINPDGTWSYEQDTVMVVPNLAEPFHHTDRNTLTKIADPTPNPLARAK